MSHQNLDTFPESYITPTSRLYGGIIDDIDKIELFRSKTHLRANTLRDGIYKVLPNPDDVTRKQQQIIDFLGGQETLEERFAALVHPDFAPFIGSVDLGRVQYPDGLEAFKAFEDACRALIVRLDTPDNPVTRFKSRNTDCMLLQTGEIQQDAEGNPVIVMTRTRRLAEMDNPIAGNRIKIRKRMTFLLTDPHQFGYIVERQDWTPEGARGVKIFNVRDVRLQRGLERLDPSIIPISTVYFAYTEPHPVQVSTVLSAHALRTVH